MTWKGYLMAKPIYIFPKIISQGNVIINITSTKTEIFILDITSWMTLYLEFFSTSRCYEKFNSNITNDYLVHCKHDLRHLSAIYNFCHIFSIRVYLCWKNLPFTWMFENPMLFVKLCCVHFFERETKSVYSKEIHSKIPCIWFHSFFLLITYT